MKTNSKKYVDGFVIPIKKSNLRAYKKMAAFGCKIWMEYGALDYYECVGDDLKNGFGLTFPKMCKLKSGETAIFAFIVFKSKSHRNQVNARVMKDPRLQMEGMKIPFSMSRFAMGGFKTLITK
jgi:uncharacterized protein YbaA (DUF1428 family)